MAKHPDPDHHTYTDEEMREIRGENNPVEAQEPRRDNDGFPIPKADGVARTTAASPEAVKASRPTGPRGQSQG